MSELDATQAQIAAFQYKLELIKEKKRLQAEVDERTANCDKIDEAIEQIDNGKYDNIPAIPIKRKRGRPKGSKNKKRDVETISKSRTSLRSVIVSSLDKQKNGLELADLVRKARESGYVAKGKKDFPSQVLDAVKDLMAIPENDQIVLYNKEKKSYTLAAYKGSTDLG